MKEEDEYGVMIKVKDNSPFEEEEAKKRLRWRMADLGVSEDDVEWISQDVPGASLEITEKNYKEHYFEREDIGTTVFSHPYKLMGFIYDRGRFTV